MIGFNDLLARNKARTEVLPLPITRARPISQSADIYWPISGPSRMSYRLSTADKIPA